LAVVGVCSRMRGSLGEKLGEGANAEIHAWAAGQVVKLFKATVLRRRAEYEARMTRAMFAGGLPTPQVLGEVIVEGRFGIVLSRLDGPTLRKLWKSGDMTSERAGAILASLYLSVHKAPVPPDAISLRDLMVAMSPGMPKHIATGVFTLLERLPPGDGLCHVDLHLDNVIMTAEGPKIIDWAFPSCAPAALDLARCHVIYSDLVYSAEGVDPRGAHALDAAVQSEYARLAGMSLVSLKAAIELYLPIMRAYALADPGTSPTRLKRLIQDVEAALNRL
jgi:tRNA A-37 threonylcarbamoyl transferase component Bud32